MEYSYDTWSRYCLVVFTFYSTQRLPYVAQTSDIIKILLSYPLIERVFFF